MHGVIQNVKQFGILVIKLSVTVLVLINLLMKMKGQTVQGVLQECQIVCLFYFGFN